MSKTSRNLLDYIRVMAGVCRDDHQDDAQLLAQFVEAHDERAFRTLLWRYGPLVWRTCARVLGDELDAEDAFQATFLALARTASKLRGDTLAGWLHRVARRTAVKADTGVRRQRSLEQRLQIAAQSATAVETDRAELYAALEEELAGLPERLRVPLVLRYLENKTQDEVARILGCSRSVALRRLARGEAILRQRLERRGLTVGVGSLTALLGGSTAVSAVPAGLMGNTVRAVLRSLSLPLPESSKAVALAEGVMKTMLVTKIKFGAVLLGATLCLAGGGLLTYQSLAGNAAKPPQPAGQPREGVEPSRQVGTRARVDYHGDPLPEGALARLGTMRLRHPAVLVKSVAFSPNGNAVASGGDDGTVRLWEAASGKEIRILQGHQGRAVNSVAFSPDGKTIVSSGHDGTVRLWEAANGKKIRTMKGHEGEAVNSVSFSPDGKTIVSGGHDGTVRLWEMASGKEIRTLQGHKGAVFSVAFSPNGKSVASGGKDGTVRLWEAASGKGIRTWVADDPWVNSVAFSPDSKSVASGGVDGTLRLWHEATGKEIYTLKGHKGSVNSVAFSSDGQTVASGGDDGALCLWDAVTGKKIRILKRLADGETIRGLAFSPDGQTMVSGGLFGLVRLRETATGKEIHTLQGHQGFVFVAAFAPDGKTVITGGSDSMARLWDAATGKEIHILQGQQGGVHSVIFSPDGKAVASGGMGGTVHLWDAGSGKQVRTLRGHQGEVGAVVFSSDGKTVASVGWYDGLVRSWDVATGREIRTLQGHSGRVLSVVFSSDGKTVASGGRYDGLVRLWETATGREIRTLKGHSGRVLSVAFSSDGKIVASGGGDDRTVRLWETATGREICTLRSHKKNKYSINKVSFSPDGRILAAASGDDVQLWDLFSGMALPPLTGHRSAVCGVTFSPDGRKLVSVSEDTTGLVWNLTHGVAHSRTKRRPGLLPALWADLASQDAGRAWRAIWTLERTPAQSVLLLRDCLRPVSAEAEKQLLRLVADLDADDFQVRESAQRELNELVPEVEPALLEALEGKPSVEMGRRLEQLLEAARVQNRRGFSVEELRSLRAVVVLERIGTPAAGEVLKTLAAGAGGFRLTQEAQAALRRLGGVRRP